MGAESRLDSPPLSISRHEYRATVSWPIANRPFVFEQVSFLGEEFTAITNDVEIVDGSVQVELPVESITSVYYRLRLN